MIDYIALTHFGKIAGLVVLPIALYMNIGYVYVRYMNRHNSAYSTLRRFLSGGWNVLDTKEEKADFDDFEVVIWIIFFAISLATWIVWIIVKLIQGIVWITVNILYLIFGGFSKEVIKLSKNEEVKTGVRVFFRKQMFLLRRKKTKEKVSLEKMNNE